MVVRYSEDVLHCERILKSISMEDYCIAVREMKKNLFIVNTPYHLLTCFILANSLFSEDENYLSLIHPHGFSKWSKDMLLSYLMSENAGYQRVFSLGNWLSSRNKSKSYRQQVLDVQKNMGNLGIEQVFLGSDIDPQNQLLVASLGLTKFWRYEDGLFSYYNADRCRSWWHAHFHRWRLRLLQYISGIKTSINLNTITASASTAGLGDYMYAPDLLQRYSPETRAISKENIDTAMQILQAKNLLPVDFTSPTVLFLSQPLIEKGWFTQVEERKCLEQVLSVCPPNTQLIYKPHPNDRAEKIAYYKQNFPQLKLSYSIIPAEIIFASSENLLAVISYQSTALLNVRCFSRPRKVQQVKAISLSDFANSPVLPPYKKIMKNAGVLFPSSLTDIQEIMSR